jgi:hypothetical protein
MHSRDSLGQYGPGGRGAFYRHWVLANGWSEAAGLGTTFVLGSVLAPAIADLRGVVPVVLGALAAVALGALLEGVLVGVAQERVLRRGLSALAGGAWIRATALGAAIAWSLGMVPSTFLTLADSAASSPPAEPGAFTQYVLAAALGAVTGPVLGMAQWTVLRRHVRAAGRWLWANALAWAVGMPFVFLGMAYVPWTASVMARFASIYAVCAGVGVVVGAIHGLVLLRLLSMPGFASGESQQAA